MKRQVPAKPEPYVLMNVREAATRLGIGEHAVRSLMRSGELYTISFGRRRIPVGAVEALRQQGIPAHCLRRR